MKALIVVFAAALTLVLIPAAGAEEPLQPLQITVSFPRNLDCNASALSTVDGTLSFHGQVYLRSSHPFINDDHSSSDGAVGCEIRALGESRGSYSVAIGGPFDPATGVALLNPFDTLRVDTAFTGSAAAAGGTGVGAASLTTSQSGGGGLSVYNPNPVDVEIHFVRDSALYGAVSNSFAGYQASLGAPHIGSGFGASLNTDATGEVRSQLDFGPNGCAQQFFQLNTTWPAVPSDDPLLDSPIGGTPTESVSQLPPDDPTCQANRRFFTIVRAQSFLSINGGCPKGRGNEEAEALTTVVNGPGITIYRSGYAVFSERVTCFVTFAGVALPRMAATLEVTAHSPLDLLVTDEAGRRTGFDLARKQILAEIPGARYTGHATEPQTVAIPYPTGDYDIGLTGTGKGTYTLTVRTLDREGVELDRRDVAGSITPGEHQQVAAHVNETGRLGSSNQAPIAVAGVDQAVECAGQQGTPVTLNGSGSSDPDGDSLTFEWRNAAGAVVGTTAMVPLTLPTGRHVFTLTVTDGKGGIATDDVVVAVQDTRPPSLAVSLSPAVLWPPNHRMVPITATITAYDSCDANPQLTLVSVTSSEPDRGLGDGDTAGDIQMPLGGDSRSFALRAERAGQGSGRVYTVRYRATDAAGNASEQVATVTVPHDQAKQ